MFTREGIHLGALYLHYYGLIIMIGALLAAWLASRQGKREGENEDTIWDMLPWILIAGIVGARIWHILTPPASMVAQGLTTHYYLTHPLDAIAIWNGGVGIPGAVMGGVLALYIYTRVKHLSFRRWLDYIAPGLALAQAIGRWGNFINQELYGSPTNLPWKIFIDPTHRISGYENQAYYHPLFLYESIWNLINMSVLLVLSRKWKDTLKAGDLFLVYLVIYPLGRFFLEFLRLDASPVLGLNINQTIMAVVAIGASITLIIRHRSTADLEELEADADTIEGSAVVSENIETAQSQPESADNQTIDAHPDVKPGEPV
jgi:phosphatidylglycerol:prolipoprotein diacylglycerol transferase